MEIYKFLLKLHRIANPIQLKHSLDAVVTNCDITSTLSKRRTKFANQTTGLADISAERAATEKAQSF